MCSFPKLKIAKGGVVDDLDAFNFVFIPENCKSLISILEASDEALQAVTSDRPILFCSRSYKHLECDVTHVEEPDKNIN